MHPTGRINNLRAGCVKAFCREVEGVARLFVVSEIYQRSETEDYSVICSKIRDIIKSKYEIVLAGIVLVETGTLPKQTTAKTVRQAIKSAFESRDLKPVFTWISGLAIKSIWLKE